MKNFIGKLGLKAKATAAAVVIGATPMVASAQVAVFEPADMGEVVFPITPESIANQIAAAGGEMIGRYAGVAIGFSLVFLFLRRLRSATPTPTPTPTKAGLGNSCISQYKSSAYSFLRTSYSRWHFESKTVG